MISSKTDYPKKLAEAEVRKQVAKKIESSGKPFEMVISSYLEDFKWENITNTDTFLDIDEKKLRDIDIVACDEPCRIDRSILYERFSATI
jgi:hypothetical protein